MSRAVYELRSVRKAGGGCKLARDASFGLPWSGLFRARDMARPLVLREVESESEKRGAAASSFHRPRQSVTSHKPSGKLIGVQLPLFPEKSTRENHPGFYRGTLDITKPLFADAEPATAFTRRPITREDPITDEDVPF